MRVRKWARESGDLSLAAPRQQIRRVLRVTGLIDVFSVYPSAEQALSGEKRAGLPSARALEPRRPADDASRGTRVRRVRPVGRSVHLQLRCGIRRPRQPASDPCDR
jgi:hypothetical protein